MKILIATGVYPPQIGGPAAYAKNLRDEFVRLGHTVVVVSYTKVERTLPFGIRHLYYFLRVLWHMSGTDFVLALDTMSVGFPAVVASRLFGKKCALRVGGDFLWESYVERTGDLVPWAKFYGKGVPLSFKEKVIFSLSKFTLRYAFKVAFNSEWQRAGTIPVYGLQAERTSVIKNFFGEPEEGQKPVKKNFLWATRPIKLKNGDMLKKAFGEAQKINPELTLETNVSAPEEWKQRLASCYAVILPSISEMSPNFILDALHFGKPFIMTRETGIYETLKDIGLFVDPLDSVDITKKILELADDATYDRYAQKARGVSFRHSWKEIAEEFLNLGK